MKILQSCYVRYEYIYSTVQYAVKVLVLYLFVWFEPKQALLIDKIALILN